MPAKGGNINFDVNMNVNRNGLNEILKPLQQIQNELNSMSSDRITTQFKQAAEQAKKLQNILNSSWNDKLGQINLDKFVQGIKTSYTNVDGLRKALSGAGQQGERAFNDVARQILHTNTELKESNKLLDSMATSMANTIKWGITSSVFNSMTSAIQSAYYYSKDLDKSLNNIRIVTGDSAEQMERFAKVANNAASNLGRSTLDYTKAALSYYQQGLSEQDVAARTEITLKAQNITGVGTEMVNYLTSVWNGFKTTAEQAELYVDKLAKVADSSASDMSQLAVAMSKVAATANVVGVDVDQLSAQLATVIATTRQAPESVGTAFKTIYTRLNDIKTGADEAEISLGNYSGKMAELGFNVLDANGRLRDTGQVMEQIGARWNTLTKQQQIYLAQTMGGQRQVTQITALFENWTMYSQLLNDSLTAQGTLTQKNDIYLESLDAHLQQLSTEAQRLYDILFDQDVVKGFADLFRGALNTFNDYIAGIGGGLNVFVNFGATVANIFNKQIANAIVGAEQKLNSFLSKRDNIKFLNDLTNTILNERTANDSYNTLDPEISEKAARAEAEIYQKTLQVKRGLTDQSYKQLLYQQEKVGQLTAQIEYINGYSAKSNEVLGYEEASLLKLKQRLRTEQDQLNLLQQRISILNLLSNDSKKTEKELINIGQSMIDAFDVSEGKARELCEILLDGQVPGQKLVNQVLRQQTTETETQKNFVAQLVTLVKQKQALDRGDVQALNQQKEASKQHSEIIQQQARHVMTIQDRIRLITSAVQGFSAILGGITTALDQNATTSQKMNGVWQGLVGGAAAVANYIAPGSGFIIQGLGGIIQQLGQITGISGWIVDHFKTTKEKIDEINSSISETNKIVSQSNKDVSTLQAMADQYAILSEKAGDYGRNVYKLTEDEKDRYYQLNNTFAKYNEEMIAGWDANGNAIIANQQQVEKLIQLYREQAQAKAGAQLGDPSKIIEEYDKDIKEKQDTYNLYKDTAGPLFDQGFGKGGIFEDIFYSEQDFENYLRDVFGPDSNNARGYRGKAFYEVINDQIRQLTKEQKNQKIGFGEEYINTILKQYRQIATALQNGIDELTPELQAKLLNFYSAIQANPQKFIDVNRAFPALENLIITSDPNNLAAQLALAQKQLNEIKDFNDNTIKTIVQYGINGYNDAFNELKNQQLFNQDLRQFFEEMLTGWTYDPNEFNATEKTSSSYDQIIRWAQDQASELAQALKAGQNEIAGALQVLDSQQYKAKLTKFDSYAQMKEFIKQAAQTALNTIDFEKLGLQGEQQEILKNYILKAYGIDYESYNNTKQEVKLNTQHIFEDTIKQLEAIALSYGKQGIDFSFLQKMFKNEEDVTKIFDFVQYIDWSKVEEDAQGAFQKAKDIYEKISNATITNISQILGANSLIKKLSEGKYNKLTKDQDALYQLLLGVNPDLLKGNSEQIKNNILAAQEDLYNRLVGKQGFIQTQIEAAQAALNSLASDASEDQKKGLESVVSYWESMLAFAKTQYDAERTQRIQEQQKTNQKIREQEQKALQQSLKIQEKARQESRKRIQQKEQQDLKRTQEKQSIGRNQQSTIDKISSGLKDKSNIKDFSSDDYAVFEYYETLGTEESKHLAQLAEQGRYRKEYLDVLRQIVEQNKNLTAEALEQQKIVLDTKKARLQQERDGLNFDQSRFNRALYFINSKNASAQSKKWAQKYYNDNYEIYQQIQSLDKEISQIDEQRAELEQKIVNLKDEQYIKQLQKQQQALDIQQKRLQREKTAHEQYLKREQQRAKKQETIAQNQLSSLKERIALFQQAEKAVNKIAEGKELNSSDFKSLAFLEDVSGQSIDFNADNSVEILKQALQIAKNITDQTKKQVAERLTASQLQKQAQIDRITSILTQLDQIGQVENTQQAERQAYLMSQLSMYGSKEDAQIALNTLKRDQSALNAEILSYTVQTKENQEATVATIQQIEESFRSIYDKLSSGGSLNTDQLKQLEEILERIRSTYPELANEAQLLLNTQLSGTQAYLDALNDVDKALRSMGYAQALQELDEELEYLDGKVASIYIQSDFEEWADHVESFLDKDLYLDIKLAEDATRDFNTVVDQIEQIQNAASKIGQNFIVAGKDIATVLEVFPAIHQNMVMLEDGSIQLSQAAVENAITAAHGQITASGQSVSVQLQRQAELLREKGDMYNQMAEEAFTLAKNETLTAAESTKKRAEFDKKLAEARTSTGNIVAENMADIQHDISVAAQDTAGEMARNTESAFNAISSMVTQLVPIFSDKFSIIANIVKNALNGVQTGWQTVQQNVVNGYSGFTSKSGVTGGRRAVNRASDEVVLATAQMRQQWQQLGQELLRNANANYEQANKLDALRVSLESKAAEVTNGLKNVQNGYGWDKKVNSSSGSPSSGNRGSGRSSRDELDDGSADLQLDDGTGGANDEPKIIDLIQEMADRYHDVNIQLSQIETTMGRLRKEQERLSGVSILGGYERQLNVLQQQVDRTKEKIRLERGQAAELRQQLAKSGVTFNADGTISNYKKAVEAQLNSANSEIALYNSLSGIAQDTWVNSIGYNPAERASQQYKQFVDNLKRYDQIIADEIPQLEDAIREVIDEQISINIEKFNTTVEVQLDLSEAERQWNNFYNNIVRRIRDDNIFEKASGLYSDFTTYFKEGNDQIDIQTRQVENILAELEKMGSGQWSSIYGDNTATALADLEKVQKSLMNSLQQAQNLVEDIYDTIFDAVKQAEKGFQQQLNTYEHISDLIQHDARVVQLIYGDDAYDSMQKFYTQQEKNNNQELDFLKKQKDMWYSLMVQMQNRMNVVNPFDVDTKEYQQMQKTLEEYKNQWMKTTKSLNTLLQNSIENIINKYTNAVDSIFDKLQKKMTSGSSLSHIGEQWELINKQADMYLDEVNSIFQLEKLQKQFQDAINNNAENLDAQKSLNNLMNEQLKYLRERDKLSQYDIDRANALLQIEVKRIALQQSAQSKTKLRLRRDSQGNYAYQYVSDQDDVTKAQNQLSDAQTALYNLTKNAYKENLNSLYGTVKQWEEKVREVYKDTTLTVEQQQQKIAFYNKYYGEIINDYVKDNQELKIFMQEDTINTLQTLYDADKFNFGELSKAKQDRLDELIQKYADYGISFNEVMSDEEGLINGKILPSYGNMADAFRNMTDEQRQALMNDLIPYWDSGIQHMTDTFSAQGGFIPTVQDSFKELDEQTKKYQSSLDTLEKSAGVNFDQIAEGIDRDISKTQSLIRSNDDLISLYRDEIHSVQGVIDKVNQLTQAYQDARNAAIKAATAANDYLNRTRENLVSATTVDNGISIEDTSPRITYTQPTKTTPVADNSALIGSNTGGNFTNQRADFSDFVDLSPGTGGSSPASSGNPNQGNGNPDLGDIVTFLHGKFYYDSYGETPWGTVPSGTKVRITYLNPDGSHPIGVSELSGGDLGWLKKDQISGYDTGGYTGEWGKSGRLAFLHEKELVLKDSDTKNILNAVGIVRNLDSLFSSLRNNNSILSNFNSKGSNDLNQKVTIQAHFPNVSNHNEIEQAFNNLINRASQYAFS